MNLRRRRFRRFRRSPEQRLDLDASRIVRVRSRDGPGDRANPTSVGYEQLHAATGTDTVDYDVERVMIGE